MRDHPGAVVEVEDLSKTYPGDTLANDVLRKGSKLMTHAHPVPRTTTPTLTGRIYAGITALSMTIGRGPAARVVTTLANVGPGDRVIDIGCGPGTAVREAARHGAIATGIDPDRTMLSFARLISAVRRARKVTWQQGSAESVPFPDSSATVVWALSSAHHWPEQSLGVAEATRLLAPGGQLLIAERVTRPGSRGHAAHGFTTEQGEQLANQLNAAGLVDVTSRTDRAGHKSLVVVTGSKKALASSS